MASQKKTGTIAEISTSSPYLFSTSFFLCDRDRVYIYTVHKNVGPRNNKYAELATAINTFKKDNQWTEDEAGTFHFKSTSAISVLVDQLLEKGFTPEVVELEGSFEYTLGEPMSQQSLAATYIPTSIPGVRALSFQVQSETALSGFESDNVWVYRYFDTPEGLFKELMVPIPHLQKVPNTTEVPIHLRSIQNEIAYFGGVSDLDELRGAILLPFDFDGTVEKMGRYYDEMNVLEEASGMEMEALLEEQDQPMYDDYARYHDVRVCWTTFLYQRLIKSKRACVSRRRPV